MGGILDITINGPREDIGRANQAYPMRGPHRGNGTGDIEPPLGAHGDWPSGSVLGRVPANSHADVILGEEIVCRGGRYSPSEERAAKAARPADQTALKTTGERDNDAIACSSERSTSSRLEGRGKPAGTSCSDTSRI